MPLPVACQDPTGALFICRGICRGEAFLDNACHFRLKTPRNNPNHSGVDAKCLARLNESLWLAPRLCLDGRGIWRLHQCDPGSWIGSPGRGERRLSRNASPLQILRGLKCTRELAQLSFLPEGAYHVARSMLVRSFVDEMIDVSPEAAQVAHVLVQLFI